MQGRKNYYFGSIPAIYSVLTARDRDKAVFIRARRVEQGRCCTEQKGMYQGRRTYTL